MIMIAPDNNAVLKRAFWSGDMDYLQWKKMVLARYDTRHKRIIAESLKHLPLFWVINEIGQVHFIKKWPVWRQWMEPSPRREALDGCWGIAALGDIQAEVEPTIAALGKKKREAIKMANVNPEKSIYQIAKDLGRDYAAVHRDVSSFRKNSTGRAMKVVPCVTNERAEHAGSSTR